VTSVGDYTFGLIRPIGLWQVFARGARVTELEKLR